MPRPGTPHRPGTAVIPDGWEAHHRPVAQATLPDKGEVRSPAPGRPAYNAATGTSTPPQGLLRYTGPCRVQALNQLDTQALVGEQQVSSRGYQVGVLFDGSEAIEADDTFTVTEVHTDGDTTLIGQPLHVRAVTRGSYVWERVLLCTDDQD